MLYFNKEEISFLAKQFTYNNLLGIELVDFDENNCIHSLTKKNYLFDSGKRLELSSECRLLLSAWNSMRYILAKNNYLVDNDSHTILANSDKIISYSLHGNDIQVIMCDFSPNTMDKIIAEYLNIVECNTCTSGFNAAFAHTEFIALFDSKLSNDEISKKTGLSSNDVNTIKQTLVATGGTAFIVEDTNKNIICIETLVKHPKEYVLIKQVISVENSTNQKVVAIKGNSQDIIDSIYIL